MPGEKVMYDYFASSGTPLSFFCCFIARTSPQFFSGPASSHKISQVFFFFLTRTLHKLLTHQTDF